MNQRYPRFSDTYSEGCRSCQAGRWVCIFLTYRCNAECPSCPSPVKQKDTIVSVFGNDPSVILRYVKSKPFTGISFSGGECFLVFERLLEWLTYFKKRLPGLYYWTYTNGLSADEKKLQKLADAGLNEIRFNIAATHYRSPLILERIKASVLLFQKVAIEVPSIPADFEELVDVLPFVDRMGVDYLNVHEYILMPQDPDYDSGGECLLSSHMQVRYDRNSSQNTERIRQFCKEKNLQIRLNNCSLQKKQNQMLRRRLMMGSILKHESEEVNAEGFLETYLLHPKKIDLQEIFELCQSPTSYRNLRKYLFHPDDVNLRMKKKAGTCAKLWFTAPLSIDDKRTLLRAELNQ